MNEREINNQFFYLYSGSYCVKNFAVPVAPEELSHLNIPKEGFQTDWRAITFIKLKREGPLPDFASTDICGRICSPKLKKIIEDYHGEADNEIQWLPMLIKDEETGEIEEHYYLHFPKVCDSLDLAKSTFSKVLGTVENAVFSYEKIKNRSIFNCLGSKHTLVASKKLKEAIFKAGCTGISVEPAHVVQVVGEKRAS